MKNRILNYIFCGIFMLIILGCGRSTDKKNESGNKNHKDISKETTQNRYIKDSLALALCQIYGLDQGIRRSPGFENKMLLVRNVDTFNFKRIVNFIKDNGMPNEELLGKSNYSQECVKAAFGAVMLHNPHMLVNDEKNFNFFVNLVNEGQLQSQYLALILDKYYWAKSSGNSVLYGSQFGKPCLNNKKETNKARKEIGLPPLKDAEFKNCNSNN